MTDQLDPLIFPESAEPVPPPPTLYYVDAEGRFLGGFSGGSPPDGAIEIPEPPEHASQIWDGEGWSAAPATRRMLRKSVVQQRLIDAGKMDAAFAALMQMPSAFARWFAPDRPEVYADDPEAVALLIAIGANVEITMAPEEN